MLERYLIYQPLNQNTSRKLKDMGVEQEKQPFMKIAADPMDPVETGSRALHILVQVCGKFELFQILEILSNQTFFTLVKSKFDFDVNNLKEKTDRMLLVSLRKDLALKVREEETKKRDQIWSQLNSIPFTSVFPLLNKGLKAS